MIHLGTNDLTIETFNIPYSSNGTILSSTSGELAEFVRYLLQWREGVFGNFLEYLFVSQLIPRKNRDWELVGGKNPEDELPFFNDEIERLVNDFNNGTITGKSEPVYLVNHYSPFKDNSQLFTGNSQDYMSDELHPNDLGYSVMAQTYFNAYSQVINLPFSSFNVAPKLVEILEPQITQPLPEEFDLLQSYPNPFNPKGGYELQVTVINYQLPEEGEVRINVYDILGRKIRTLVQDEKQVGYHQTIWDGRNDYGNIVSSGVYFYIMQTEEFVKQKRLIILN